MPQAVRTVYIELRASADRLQADMREAGTSLEKIGKTGAQSSHLIASGMETAAVSVAVFGHELSGSLAVLSRYSSIVAGSVANADALANSYRGVRLALSPTPFTAATIAVGILAEATVRLTNARAKLIEQQSAFAAKNQQSIYSVEALDATAKLSGKDPGSLNAIYRSFNSRSSSNPGEVRSGLDALGITDGGSLSEIAQAFTSIEDPVKRANAAFLIFGSEGGAALQQLDGKFLNGMNAVKDYGLTLDTISRNQIFSFRQDLQSLKTAITDFSDIRGAWEGFKQGVEAVAAATEDAAKRGASALDTLIQKHATTLHALYSVTIGQINDPNGGLSVPTPGVAKMVAVQTGHAAGDMFSQARGVADRQSKTPEGLRRALAEKTSEANDLYRQMQADEKAKADTPGAGLGGRERFDLATRQQSAAALARIYKDQLETLDAGKVRAGNALSAAAQLAATQKQSSEAQIELSRLTAQSQSDAISEPHIRAVAQADADVELARNRLAKLKPIYQAELNAQVAAINTHAGLDGTASGRASADGQISSARSEAAQRLSELASGVAQAEQKAKNVRITAAREVGQEWNDAIHHQGEALAQTWKEGQERVAEYTVRLTQIQERVGEIQARAEGQVKASGFDRQRLQLDRNYNLKPSHSNSEQISYLEQVARIEERREAARLQGLKTALETAKAGEDQVRTAELQAQYDEASAESSNRRLADQSRIDERKESHTLRFRLAQRLSTENLSSNLGGALAQGVSTGKVGTEVRQALSGIGKQIMGDVFDRLITTILTQTGVTTLLTAATSANTVATISSSATKAVGGIFGAAKGLLHLIPGIGGLFADGGRPPVGVPSIIGERGPELWVPDQAGTIIPNHMISGGVTSSSPYALPSGFSGGVASISSAAGSNTSISGGSHTFHINGATNPAAVAREVARYLKGTSPRFSPANS